jgi:hypothetical protein
VASQAVIGQGTGKFNFGALPVTLQTPIMIADTSSSQTLTTTGALSVVSIVGNAPTSTALGGAITLQGGSVTVAAPIQALAGNITLKSSAGDVVVTGGGALIAHGVAKQFVDIVQYASAGSITLAANQGTVNIESGAVVDFAGAALGGNGGGLTISTTNSTIPVALNGTLLGSTAAGYNGSIFNLNTSGAVVLDDLAQIVTGAGITGGIAVHTGQGDLTLNRTLTASQVALVADGGSITVNGTIDASGPAGGTIQLYGTGSVIGGVVVGGVTVNGSLLARSSKPNQLGGIVEIGTSGRFDPATGTYNTGYGYENIAAANSGTITIGPNALIDVSGGTRGDLSGGTVLLRAPLLNDGSVNVVLSPSAMFRGARSVSLESYATWSTADATIGAQHFDSIVDPAGWYNSSGNLLAGSFTNAGGTPVATWNGSTLTNNDGTTHDLKYYLTNDFFAPAAANADHQTFYGYVNGDATAATPGTLMGFIEAPGFQPAANTSGIANFQRVAGVELDNPVSAGVNNGDIQVLSNWNLGAQRADGSLLFRTNGLAPRITFRAAGNIAINGSISDGFHETVAFHAPSAPSGTATNTSVLTTYHSISTNASFDISNVNTGGLPFDRVGQAAQTPATFLQLGVASATTPNAYYTNYQSYITTWGISFARTLKAGGFGTGGTTQSAAVTTALNTANAAYSSTDLNAYAAYVTAYKAYITAFTTWKTGLGGALAGSLPVALLAPPKIAPQGPPGIVSNAPNPTGGFPTSRRLPEWIWRPK